MTDHVLTHPDAESLSLSRRHLLSALAAAGSGLGGLAAAEATAAAPVPGVPMQRPQDTNMRPIDRAFVRIREGLVHYRHVGQVQGAHKGSKGPLPLYMVHAGPGSSRGLERLLGRFRADRAALAPDTLGNGDSAAPDVAQPEVAYYAESVVRILDALGIEQVDFYGAHTGAHIGTELALRWPSRVRRMIFDGVTLFPPDFRAELLAHYAPPMQPDEFGRQFPWAWQFVRDMGLFFPHYMRDPAHRLGGAVGPPAALHAGAVDVLKALTTYHLGYHAVFRHDIENRLPRLSLPVLCMGFESDPMHTYVEQAAALIPGARKVLIAPGEGPDAGVAAIEKFLDAA